LDAERLDALTALRFFAAMMVAVGHTAKLLCRSTDDPFAHVATQQGVSFFFVLSGFILCYKYPMLENGRARLKFWAYRVARIWPAHFTTAMLFMLTLPPVLWWTCGKRSVWVIISNLTMTQAFIPPVKFYFGVNPPSWSISCEFFFYLMFPLLLIGWNKNWRVKLLVCAALVLATLFTYSLHAPQTYSHDALYFQRWLVYINPVIRLFEFVLGMSTALLYSRLARSFQRWTGPEITWLQVTAVFASLISLATCSSLIRVLPLPTLPSACDEWLTGSGGCFAYAFLIFAMAQTRGSCSRALSIPALVWLGEISYSIYLVHDVLLNIYAVYFYPFCSNTNQPVWLCQSVFWAALILICAAMYYLIERPARKLLPKLILGVVDRFSLQPPKRSPSVAQSADRAITKV
jgi:peptidoglycan/LPS O-acetylase OafA/YrhL